MMDFISVPLVVGIVCAGIYGLFELFVRKRERLAIIEKIGDKLDASAFDGKLGLPHYMRNFSFSSRVPFGGNRIRFVGRLYY